VSVAVAARLLDVSRTTVEAWRQTGVLAAAPAQRRRHEVTIDSLVRIQALLGELRQLGKDRELRDYVWWSAQDTAARWATLSPRSRADCSTIPTKLARQQIAALRGRAKASFLLAVEDIRRRGCAAAGVRLAGEALLGVCRLDLYGAWRLLTVFEDQNRCVLLMVAEHTAQPIPTVCCTQHSTSTNPKSPGPSHRAATPKASHRWTSTSSNGLSSAYETSAARCQPVPEHLFVDVGYSSRVHRRPRRARRRRAGRSAAAPRRASRPIPRRHLGPGRPRAAQAQTRSARSGPAPGPGSGRAGLPRA
jgi:hypothetical protein